MSRPLYEIASEVRKYWENVNYAAKPYLEAMLGLDSIGDHFGFDSARNIVLYFLSNASQFKGEDAKRIKAELNLILKGA